MKRIKLHIAKKLQFAPYRAKKIFPYDTDRYVHVQVNRVNIGKYEVQTIYSYTDLTEHTVTPPSPIEPDTNMVEVLGNWYHTIDMNQSYTYG